MALHDYFVENFGFGLWFFAVFCEEVNCCYMFVFLVVNCIRVVCHLTRHLIYGCKRLSRLLMAEK